MTRPQRKLLIGIAAAALLVGCSSDGLDPSTSVDSNVGGQEPPATDTRVSEVSLPTLSSQP